MMTPELADRIISGAHRGRLILTLDEVETMLHEIPAKTIVVVDSEVVTVAELPIFVIDEIDPFPPALELVTSWQLGLAASVADGCIDYDDAERLWDRESDDAP